MMPVTVVGMIVQPCRVDAGDRQKRSTALRRDRCSSAALRAQRARQLEERLRAPAWEDHDLVFTNEVGQPVRQRNAHQAFKDLLVTAGLPRSHRPHDLRHSMATYLVAGSVPERVVMEILGHSTLAMTQRYSHVLSPMVQDAAAKLEALWAGAASLR